MGRFFQKCFSLNAMCQNVTKPCFGPSVLTPVLFPWGQLLFAALFPLMASLGAMSTPAIHSISIRGDGVPARVTPPEKLLGTTQKTTQGYSNRECLTAYYND